MRTSIYKRSKAVAALASTAISANGATNGLSVDLLQAGAGDYRSVLFIAQSGTLTDGTYALSLEHSDNGSSWSAAGTATQGSATFVATEDNAIEELGYAGPKRYVRLVVTASGVTTGGTVSAIAVLYDTAGNQR